ncbi:MAG: hypothetical protein JOZ69_17250, partial [Myxococcales bacterium]|nr:hypothetical protein [Myxococcales bacterium]
GLGPALVQYLVRSRVEGEVCVAEWPPPSAFDDAPVRRWILRVAEIPDRMRPMLHTTPGITCFLQAGAGVAVEAGYRHAVELRACPVFDPAGIVLLRGGESEPWIVEHLPAMGPLSAFARIELRSGGPEGAPASQARKADVVRVPLRVLPSTSPRREVTATWVPADQLPLLRRLAYALPRSAIAQARLALTARGAFLRSRAGVEAVPLGTFYVELHPNLYVPAGYEVTPAVAPDVLARAIDASPAHVLFLDTSARAWAVAESAFAPLEAALLDAPPWEPLVSTAIERSLEEAAIDLKATPVGVLPLRGVEPATARSADR